MTDAARFRTDLLESAVPYAIDAISEVERRRIERRLRSADPATAAAFSAVLRGTREAVAAMTVVDVLAPPADLEQRVQSALDAVARGTGRRPAGSAWLMAAAAAAVVAATAGAIAVWNTQIPAPETISATVIESNPDARTHRVSTATGGVVTVWTSAALGAASVTLDELPPLPSGRAYQVWLVARGGDARSVAVVPDPARRAAVTRYDTADTLAITVEPVTGSPAPTSAVIAAVELG